ncbi:hypothetical protein CDAR_566021 [Caerostris darwini]|uniref:Uncharacterized protein n=1 Tax=Caerostris darwini TaxID=1538125 RepID=A0AAV4W617_9ARAC|nr:hypothetical protein CDAR_566021 [Caerostris darwini]
MLHRSNFDLFSIFHLISHNQSIKIFHSSFEKLRRTSRMAGIKFRLLLSTLLSFFIWPNEEVTSSFFNTYERNLLERKKNNNSTYPRRQEDPNEVDCAPSLLNYSTFKPRVGNTVVD